MTTTKRHHGATHKQWFATRTALLEAEHATISRTLVVLGWSMLGLARQVGRSATTGRNWNRPDYRVPPEVVAWLARRLADHEAVMRDDPPPTAQDARQSP